MTIFDVANGLPNGLHDAEVESIRIDYLKRSVEFELDVWTGTMADPATRETYRRALLTIIDFQYCVMEQPEERYPFASADTLTIDLAEAAHVVPSSAAFGCRLWVNEWNGSIHLAAGSAKIVWQGEPINRHAPTG